MTSRVQTSMEMFGNSRQAPYDANLLAVGEETMERESVDNSGVTMVSGKMRNIYFTARRTETVNNIRALTAGTAGAGLTISRVGIYSVGSDGSLLSLLASTPNDTTLFTATVTRYSKGLSAAWNKVVGTRYCASVLVVGTTMPLLLGKPGVGAIAAEQFLSAPMLTSESSATQTDLPASLTLAQLVQSPGRYYIAMVP